MSVSSVISVSNISKIFKTYDSKFVALNDVSFDIKSNEFVIISGENGSGKSLLMSIIAGLEKPTEGSVKTSSCIGLVFQDADAAILGDTPNDDIMFSLVNIGKKKKEAKEIANDILKRINLYEKKDSPSHSLSGGEKRRLAIGSILALGFKIIIMDEPYSNLDYSGVKDVNKLIMSLLNDGVTIVLLTHEIEKCLGKSDRLIIMQKGEVKYNGIPSGILGKPLAEWGIKNPLSSYTNISDLFWE